MDSDTSLDNLFADIASPDQAAKIVDQVIARLIAPFHETVSWGDRLLTLDKSVGFRDDPTFAAAFAKMSTSTGQTQYRAPDGIAWRLNTLVWAARNALRIEGDFVECGVFEGEMSWLVTQMVDLAAAGRTFFLFDTFDGFSSKYSSPETDVPHDPHLFQLHDEIYRDPRLYPQVCALFADNPNVRIVKGVVPDSLHDSAPAKIAYLHLDMNSPGPEIGALNVLYDRISPGGVIILDDYGWKLFRMQKAAADAWFAERGHTVLEMPTGQGLVVKR
ncbi:MAG: TylF/MycF/NovP-related O-methyltransferase [Alphaproteobacteria bacterium]|nr:TylF/MycF/NovP-related O-methyltransferase [Alphaproteobacteria bacterium]MDZ4762514.1 TylF/MycF/NovP-related O-methyltransferase [Alphaproteobacteria bacterium]